MQSQEKQYTICSSDSSSTSRPGGLLWVQTPSPKILKPETPKPAKPSFQASLRGSFKGSFEGGDWSVRDLESSFAPGLLSGLELNGWLCTRGFLGFRPPPVKYRYILHTSMRVYLPSSVLEANCELPISQLKRRWKPKVESAKHESYPSPQPQNHHPKAHNVKDLNPETSKPQNPKGLDSKPLKPSIKPSTRNPKP